VNVPHPALVFTSTSSRYIPGLPTAYKTTRRNNPEHRSRQTQIVRTSNLLKKKYIPPPHRDLLFLVIQSLLYFFFADYYYENHSITSIVGRVNSNSVSHNEAKIKLVLNACKGVVKQAVCEIHPAPRPKSSKLFVCFLLITTSSFILFTPNDLKSRIS
jgi:hypothetical protein